LKKNIFRNSKTRLWTKAIHLTSRLMKSKNGYSFFDDIDIEFNRLLKKRKVILQYKTIWTTQSDKNQWVYAQDFSDVAIILQGPITRDSSFLLRSVQHYLSLYPNLTIVVSSWRDSCFEDFINACEFLPIDQRRRLHFLSNEKPVNHGIANVNLQIVSTLNALKLIEQLGKRFTIKSRVDQVLSCHLSISILKQKFYDSSLRDTQKSKIVIGNRNTFLFRPYSFSDMLQFSETDTLIEFWDTPHDPRSAIEANVTLSKTPMQWSKQNFAEVYLVRNYLVRAGFQPLYSFHSHFQALLEYFAVIDSESIGFYWDKYTHNQSSWTRSDFPYTTYEISEFEYDNPEFIYRNMDRFEMICEQEW
jgi:hypothetical protein